jgi:uncharacterized membrane protein
MSQYKAQAEILIEKIAITEGEKFSCDHDKILSDLNHGYVGSSIAVKILSVIGGVMATVFFTGFLLLLKIYESEQAMLLLGVILIGASIGITHLTKSVLMDTICVCTNLVGVVFFTSGSVMLTGSVLTESITGIASILIVLSVIIFITGKNSILKFLSILIINASMVAIIMHSRNLYLFTFFVCAVTLVFTFLSLYESKIIAASKFLNQSFSPLWMGILISFMAALYINQFDLIEFFRLPMIHFWMTPLIIIACVLILAIKLLNRFKVEKQKQIWIYPLIIIPLLPGLLSPSLAGSFLILLLSFYMGHRLGFVIGLLMLIYSTFMFYYDLQLTLLIKSMILMLTGSLFLLAYWLFSRLFPTKILNPAEHEK